MYRACVADVSRVPMPTRLRVERWSFSFMELLNDFMGRREFMTYLEKEFSGKKVWQKCIFLLLPVMSDTVQMFVKTLRVGVIMYIVIITVILWSNNHSYDSDSNNNKAEEYIWLLFIQFKYNI